jgi:DNA-binding NarL/FixJ family response regulator
VVVEAAVSLRDEFRATREIMRRLPRTKIIHHASTAEELSQDDECEGEDAESTFSQALRLAGAGSSAAAGRAAASQDLGLTSREREVLELLANGLAMKVIAHRLGITYAPWRFTSTR